MTYGFTVVYKVRAENREAVEHALRAMTHLSRQEPGNLIYRAHAALNDPNQFMVYEYYDTQASFETHRDTNYFHKYFHGVVSPSVVERNFVEYRELEPVDDALT